MGKVIHLSKRRKKLTEAFIEKKVKKLPITELSSVLFCPECNIQMTEILAWGVQGKDFDFLEEGTDVEFNLERGPKGLRAANVRIVK